MMTPSGAAKARVRQETALFRQRRNILLIKIPTYWFDDARARSRARAFSLAFFQLRRNAKEKSDPLYGGGKGVP